MNILLGINNWEVGGAENFVYDLARSLSQKGHRITLFIKDDHGHYQDKLEQLLGAEKSNIKILHKYQPSKLLDLILWNLNGIGNKLGLDKTRNKLISWLNRKAMNRYLKTEKIEVINSHLFETDEFLSLTINLPHVVSMHGPYETYLDSDNEYGRKNDQGINEGFIKRADYVLTKSKNVIYIADKNLNVLEHFSSSDIIRRKIYNGYSKQPKAPESIVQDKKSFTFGMVARGVEAKGWEIAIKSFLELKNSNSTQTRLQLLYTELDYMKNLKATYARARNIEFLGFIEGTNKEKYQRNFDVTLLPTSDDCLPVSIVESLMLNVPVISTAVGEIPNMLRGENKSAGIVLELSPEDNKPTTEQLTSAMTKYIEDSELHKEHKQNTTIFAKKFEMENCIAKYIEAYKNAINKFNQRQ